MGKMHIRGESVGVVATLFGIFYWPIESLIHASLFDEGTFVEQLIHPAINEVWMRSLIAVSFVVFGLYAHRAVRRRQHLIERLRAQEARARRIIESAPEAYVSIDAQSNVTGWNPSAEQLFGWRADEVLGRPLTELIIPERFRAAHLEGIAHYLESGIGPRLYRTVQTVAVNRDGREIPVSMAVVPLNSEQGREFYAFIRPLNG